MSNALVNYLLGASFNLAVAVVAVRFVYYPVTQEKRYIFSFLAFNTVVYFVLGLLTSVELSIGVGFGLFALFSLLRYRTDEIPIREMTYLFALIALAVINSILSASGDLTRALIANGVIVALLWVLEKGWGFHFEESKRILYDRIDLIAPDKYALLLADLRERTGLPIRLVHVGRLNLLRDTAELKVYYQEPKGGALAAQTQSGPGEAAKGNSA